MKRSPEAARLVKEVIENEENIATVIARIHQIDKDFQKNPPVSKKRESTLESVEKKPVSIKKTPFIKYFFSERREIIQRSYEIAFYEPRYFGLTFHLSEEGVGYLQEILEKALNFVLPLLKKILEESWQVLEPHRYNGFYYLHQALRNFCSKFIIDRRSIKRNLELATGFDEDLLMLLQHAKYLRYIKEGIYLYFANNESQEMVNLMVFIENLLDKKRHFSLTNYLLMTYSIFYRTNFSLKKIISLKDLEEMEEARFLTTQKVRYIMQKSLQQIKSSLESNERRLFPLQYIQQDHPSYIGDFYRERFQKEFNENFLEKDLLGAVSVFIDCFVKYGQKILTQEVDLKKEELLIKTPIFIRIWDDFIKSLKRIRADIKHFQEKFGHFFLKFEVYWEMKSGSPQINPTKEEDMSRLVDQAVDEFFSFFSSFSALLYNDYILTNQINQEDVFVKLETRKTPINTLAGQTFIPFADFFPDSYAGESVLEILSNLSSLAGTFLYVMGHKDIREQLEKKPRLMDENRRYIARLVKLNN